MYLEQFNGTNYRVVETVKNCISHLVVQRESTFIWWSWWVDVYRSNYIFDINIDGLYDNPEMTYEHKFLYYWLFKQKGWDFICTRE